ncbi:DUF397 domain-containing protein [Actinomadura harenae]|uniref:DUF397 domain-containing protein n=1 Tax=Actinomadura harenae TaxID=2483351 RepID=A0A3M2LGU3_9ACTN|nr:DUF397 domain-containing protein [Actinomadura harenae]
MSTPDLARAQWRKSSRSNGSGGACVEVTLALPCVAVRDSKDASGPVLALEPAAWHQLVHQVKYGQPDTI